QRCARTPVMRPAGLRPGGCLGERRRHSTASDLRASLARSRRSLAVLGGLMLDSGTRVSCTARLMSLYAGVTGRGAASLMYSRSTDANGYCFLSILSYSA